MAEQSSFLAEKRYAVVTGANKGIGLEVCRQLAAQGVVVVLTSRDEKRGLQALSSLKKSGLDSDNLEFHQLDVTDPTSVASITHFLESNFGKLDILVNNAGILGATADFNALTAAGFPDKVNVDTSMVTQTYEQAQECLETNFYGVKTATQALLPLLKLSNSPRIINVSSLAGKLCHIRNDRIRGVLDNVEELTEEKVDSILDEFLRDFKDGSVLEKGWNPVFSAYFASKAALNAYTRILEKKYPSMIINCLCPGFIKTDINENVGPIPLEVGGARVVRRYAVVTGANKGIGLEVCRQLAAQGVAVVLTSRDEKRGLQALDNLRKSGLNSDNLEFHQLDVSDPASVASLAHFLEAKFGKLDILVNNAGILGADVADFNAFMAAGFPEMVYVATDKVTQTYEQAQECLKTNYYGVKTATKALLPLLELSNSPRIINVSSSAGMLCYIQNDQIRGVLDNVEELTEEKVDSILDEFLRDFKDGSFVEKGWVPALSAYFASKAALSAYTRILAKKYPSMIINCLCPGFIKTDINENAGLSPVEVGGARVVRLALAPHGSPSGLYYTNDQVTPF